MQELISGLILLGFYTGLCLLSRWSFQYYKIFIFDKLKEFKYFLYENKISRTIKFKENHDHKVCDTLWKIIFYSVSTSLVIYFANQLYLFSDVNNSWREIVSTHNSYFKNFYIFELGYYFSGLLSLWFELEEHRSDVSLLYTHHIATIFLIAGSYIMGFEKIGVLVLFAHDLSDWFLEIGKFMLYFELLDVITTTWYIILVLAWTGLRMIYFPFCVIWSCYMFMNRQVEFSFANSDSIETYPNELPFIIVLIILLLMNIYWTFALLSLGYRKIVTGERMVDHREKNAHSKPKPKRIED